LLELEVLFSKGCPEVYFNGSINADIVVIVVPEIGVVL
jgi:hypothetical protein